MNPLDHMQTNGNIGKIKRFEAKHRTTNAKIQAETADKAAAARKLAMYRHNQATALDMNKPHPYLMKKGITNPIGVKIYKGWLQIPAFNKQGVLTILQSIRETGFKSILKDNIFSGSAISIGGNSHNKQLPALFCEGRATGQSLHAATHLSYPKTNGLQVVIAFNSNNLSHIAQNIREHYPDHPILIGADNDTQNTVNTGVLKAKDIQTQMSQVKVVYPEFTTEDVQRLFQGNGSVPTDFHDMHLLHSLEHVMKYLRSRANSVLEYNQGNYLSINI
ncbi:hypothetical protein PT286_02080 [Neisseriaceae bacterium ESL0693]|nr:hypothetical protein [Neisseriaceae bacterium ESL0693]